MARTGLENLLDDRDVYGSRLKGLFRRMEEKLKEIPYIDKLLAWIGNGQWL